MSLWVRQLYIFGPKCFLLNSVIITVQYILGSVVLVEFLTGGDLKFCSRHTCVSNATDSKENKFTGRSIFILTVPLFGLHQKNKQKTPLYYSAENVATVSYTSFLGAEPKSLHAQGTWGQNVEILLRSGRSTKVSENINYHSR